VRRAVGRAAETVREFGRIAILFGERGGKYPDGNSVLVRGRDTAAVLDPSLTVGRACPPPAGVDLVLLSHVHEDHFAGAYRFPSAAIYAHREEVSGLHSLDRLLEMYGCGAEEAPALREALVERFRYRARPDAGAFDDGAVFDLGGVSVRTIHLPGHTRGHCAMLVEPEGVLFLGDIGLGRFGPYYGDPGSDLEAFERSLCRVREIPARVWVSFHEAGVIEGAAEFAAALERFRARIVEREEVLWEYLAEPRTLDELVARRIFYPPSVQWPGVEAVERRSIAQHLLRWKREGRIQQCDGERYVRG
jgi:glyoxylase-like metal-dependent hydrolase (beta-lactamase superfamily II)